MGERNDNRGYEAESSAETITLRNKDTYQR